MVSADGASIGQATDFQGFRSVQVDEAASMINCNLSTSDGKVFVFSKNMEGVGGQFFIYDKSVTEATCDKLEK